MLGSAILSFLQPSVVNYVAIPVAHAQEISPQQVSLKDIIKDKINNIALANKISTTTLYNLIKSESSLDENIKDGDMDFLCPIGINKGKPVRARGVSQITECYHPEITDKDAYDLDFAIDWSAKQIANNTAWKEHTMCNCYTYAKTRIKNLPAMKDIHPNSNYPIVGGLVILYYNNQKHIGVISKVLKEGIKIDEANFEPCSFGTRLISMTDTHLVGFWSNLD